MVSFLQVCQPEPCAHLSPPPYAPHALIYTQILNRHVACYDVKSPAAGKGSMATPSATAVDHFGQFSCLGGSKLPSYFVSNIIWVYMFLLRTQYVSAQSRSASISGRRFCFALKCAGGERLG